MAKVISFINQKGGVGKTTSCINLATAYASLGYRVLIIDMDYQRSASIGLVDNCEKPHTIKSLLVGLKKIDDNIILPTKYTNMDIIIGSKDYIDIENALQGMREKEFLLKVKIEPIKYKYDFILLDCPPSLGIMTLNSLCASDSIIVPVQCEFYALEGLKELMYTVRQVRRYLNKELDIDGILLTMLDKRSIITKSIIEEIKTLYPDKVLKTIIPRNIDISVAPKFRQTVVGYKPMCSGAIAYIELAKELLKQHNKITLSNDIKFLS